MGQGTALAKMLPPSDVYLNSNDWCACRAPRLPAGGTLPATHPWSAATARLNAAAEAACVPSWGHSPTQLHQQHVLSLQRGAALPSRRLYPW